MYANRAALVTPVDPPPDVLVTDVCVDPDGCANACMDPHADAACAQLYKRC